MKTRTLVSLFASSLTALALTAGLLAQETAKPATPPKPAAPPAGATPEVTLTESDVITGTMDIDFGTRANLDTTGDLKPGSPALGAKDKYKFTFSVAKTTEFSGEISRQPNLYSKIITSKKQDAL